MFTTILSYVDDDFKPPKFSLSPIFIDEAQKILHENSIPDTDICRESKFEYILATQDKILLQSAIGEYNTIKLLRNIAQQFSFKTNENEYFKKLSQFEYLEFQNNNKFKANPVFISKDNLYNIELDYQKSKKLHSHTSLSNATNYILEYNSNIIKNGKIKICYIDGTEKYVRYYNFITADECNNIISQVKALNLELESIDDDLKQESA